MVITPKLIQELSKPENILKVDAFLGAFIRGDYRYLVSLSTEKATVIFEITEN